jgi:hypothetical protein
MCSFALSAALGPCGVSSLRVGQLGFGYWGFGCLEPFLNVTNRGRLETFLGDDGPHCLALFRAGHRQDGLGSKIDDDWLGTVYGSG